jgi:hypothetical protein
VAIPLMKMTSERTEKQGFIDWKLPLPCYCLIPTGIF